MKVRTHARTYTHTESLSLSPSLSLCLSLSPTTMGNTIVLLLLVCNISLFCLSFFCAIIIKILLLAFCLKFLMKLLWKRCCGFNFFFFSFSFFNNFIRALSSFGEYYLPCSLPLVLLTSSHLFIFSSLHSSSVFLTLLYFFNY